MIVEIKVKRDDGTVLIVMEGPAFNRMNWTTHGGNNSPVERGIALDGFDYVPILRPVK